MPLILPGNVGSATAATGFNVANSVRFDSGDSPYLFKSNASGNSDMTKFTASFWFKKAKPVVTNGGGLFMIKSATSDANDKFHIYLMDDQMHCTIFDSSGSTEGNIKPNRVFRDPAAWVHVTYRYDSTQGTDSNRTRLYINGVQETSLGTANYPDQNHAQPIDNSTEMALGRVTYNNGSHYEFDGYMAEIVLLDGVSADPTSFGEFDSDSGIWKPIDVSGLTFGDGGFYLDFKASDNLGNDANGGTDFSEQNIVAIDQSIDTCTNNFATLNPVQAALSSATFSEGNLKSVTAGTSGENFGGGSSIGVASGKWYFEAKATVGSGTSDRNVIGVTGELSTIALDKSYVGTNSTVHYQSYNGKVLKNDSDVYTGSTYATGDIIQIALDIDNLHVYFGKNGTYQNSGDPTTGATGTGAVDLVALTSTTDGFYFIYHGDNSGASGPVSTFEFNFGSPSYSESGGETDGNGYGNFAHAVPSGYYSLNTKNLAEYG
jgi:hypothetical protein